MSSPRTVEGPCQAAGRLHEYRGDSSRPHWRHTREVEARPRARKRRGRTVVFFQTPQPSTSSTTTNDKTQTAAQRAAGLRHTAQPAPGRFPGETPGPRQRRAAFGNCHPCPNLPLLNNGHTHMHTSHSLVRLVEERGRAGPRRRYARDLRRHREGSVAGIRLQGRTGLQPPDSYIGHPLSDIGPS